MILVVFIVILLIFFRIKRKFRNTCKLQLHTKMLLRYRVHKRISLFNNFSMIYFL